MKAFCRNCEGERNHKEIYSKKINGNQNDYLFWFESYQIIECLGCENISFRTIYGNSEMVDTNEYGEEIYWEEINIYPRFLKKGTEIFDVNYLPKKIREIYLETVNALKNDLFILASAGLRACIEAICIDKKIVKSNLSDKINSLSEKGYLTVNDSNMLHSIRFLGNDVLHNIDKPDQHTVYILFEIVNHTLESLYIKDRKMKDSNYLIINNIDSFLKAIRNNIKEEQIDHLFTLNEIVSKEVDFLEYIEDNQKFKVLKVPKATFYLSDIS